MVHLEQKCARILQPPVNERHVEFRAGCPMVRVELRLTRHDHFMLAAEQHQNPMNLDGGDSLSGYFPLNAVRTKDNVSVTAAFQNFLVHLPVSSLVAAASAGSVHNDFAGGPAGRKIHSHHSLP